MGRERLTSPRPRKARSFNKTIGGLWFRSETGLHWKGTRIVGRSSQGTPWQGGFEYQKLVGLRTLGLQLGEARHEREIIYAKSGCRSRSIDVRTGEENAGCALH